MSDFKANRRKCTKFDFRGSAPYPAEGQYSPDLPAVFQGTSFRGKEGKGEVKRVRKRERKNNGRERRVAPPNGDSGSGSGGGKGRQKGKNGSLGWGVQALLFSTLSTVTGYNSKTMMIRSYFGKLRNFRSISLEVTRLFSPYASSEPNKNGIMNTKITG